MAKKTYVLDTSALITDTDCVNGYGNNDILIPIKVLEELDKHKKRQDLVGASARTVIRFLDSLRSKGSLYEGVRLGKGKGMQQMTGLQDSSVDRIDTMREVELFERAAARHQAKLCCRKPFPNDPWT
jgi:predicted ribonuclease YlaK